MTILHINSEFSTNSLYINLLKELSLLNVKQINYAPIKSKNKYRANTFKNSNISFLYSKPLKKNHRLLYFSKIFYLENDILNQVTLENIKLIHAHKLFSDGGIALKLKRKYGIPYIVAIRASDIYIFYKYMKHLKWYAKHILLNASKIVLLNDYYRNDLKKIHPKAYTDFEPNIVTIPNGISKEWFDVYTKNMPNYTINHNEAIQLVYTGSFIPRKRVLELMQAVATLNQEGKEIVLTIVGKGGKHQKKVEEFAHKYEFINYLGRLNVSQMKELYKHMDIFILPSLRETFGLVYIEALSQGLPIIYTKGEAIDSYFEDGEVGYALEALTAENLFTTIEEIQKNYTKITSNCLKKATNFNWQSIAHHYMQIYKSIVS